MSREAAMAQLTGSPVTTEVTTQSPGLTAVPSEAPKPTELDSTRFANLARKEAEIVKSREALKAREMEITALEERLKPIEQKWKDFEELKVKDQVAAMKMAGFSDTDLLNFLAAHEDKSTPEEKAAKAAQTEIQKFKDEQAKAHKEEQDRINTQVLDRFKKDITKTVTADKEKYEYINHHGALAEELIYEYVAQVLEDTKEVISIQEAAEAIESFYEESDKAMSVLKKRQPKAAETPQETKDEPLRAEVSARPPSKTLSNRAVATTPSSIPRRETPSQKRERLIEKLRGG